MLRSSLIYLSKASWARNIVVNWSVARRVASRFIAGETLADAIRVVRELNKKNINATLDHLGEHTSSPEIARRAVQDVFGMFDAIGQSGVRSNVSIKLTQIGLALDAELCAQNLAEILRKAAENKSFVRVDMEDSPWVDITLSMVRRMREDLGFDNVGVVIQSYLFRSEADIYKLGEEGICVRLCKGAYKEPPDIAYPKKTDVDASYDRLTRSLIDSSRNLGYPELSPDGIIPPLPALATHDEARINCALEYIQQTGMPSRAIEFQMLNGIRRDLQEKLAAMGYPVRVYVPYGTEWYPYFTRRLAERPANLWFFVSNFFRQ
jgi:proline dehydrogenase